MDAELVGSLASCASVLLNISPIRDVLAIHRTRSVTERSILPYCMMMVDGANWVVFATLIGNFFPIGATNAFGCLCGITYSVVYLRNCWDDKRPGVRRQASIIFGAAVSIVGLVVVLSVVFVSILSSDTATDSIGSFVDIFNVCLYASPLALAWKVLRTRCTSGMYLPLSVTIICASALWAAYGFLTVDYFVAAPQSVGLMAGLVQLSLFIRFGIADNNQPSETVADLGANDDPGDGPRSGPGPDGGGRFPAKTAACEEALGRGSANSLMVLISAVMSSVISVLFLVWVMDKLHRYQQEIEALSSRIDISETEKTAKKVVNALNATNATLNKINAQSIDKINGAETSLYKEKADHDATKGLLHRAEQENVALAGRVAHANQERVSKSDQLEKITSEHVLLAERYETLERQLAAANYKLAVTGAQLEDEKEKTVDLTQRLANSARLRLIVSTKLREQKIENGVVVQRLATCHAGLAAASEELAGKDALIAEQQKQVDELQRAMMNLQLSASTPSLAVTAAAAMTSTKQDATASIQDDCSSSGTVTLSPTGSGSGSFGGGFNGSFSGSFSNSVSRTSSSISTDTDTSNSDGDGNGMAQSAVAAPPIPALRSPPNVRAPPAVTHTHTGPHDKPKRDKRGRRGGKKHNGNSRSTANKIARMRAGLDRGFS
eukprot:g6803.t1